MNTVVAVPKMFTCKVCGCQFSGTGKRGRPFHKCPVCRQVPGAGAGETKIASEAPPVA